VLVEIRRDTAMYKSFYASLPVAGVSGSLANLGKGTVLENNLHAKSGYIERVRAYCGYLNNAQQQECCLSIILNGYSGSASAAKALLEKVIVTLYQTK
jgi:serine-type D-Ala-D-Ala carboxypeptidase/endopeptidase (penicillin-binding protein 4)